MVLDCVHWRRTVEDVGIEELYRRVDPYDVRPLGWVAHSDSFHIFRNLPDLGTVPRTRRSVRELADGFPQGAQQNLLTIFHFLPGHSSMIIDR